MNYDVPSFVTNPDPTLYRSDNYIVVDFETTNLNNGDPINEANNIVLIGWKNKSERGAHVYPPEPRYIESFLRALEKADFMVAHNAKFECGWLKRLGVDLSKVKVFCTQIAEYTIRSNRRGSVSLQACLLRRGLTAKENLISSMMKSGTCPSEMPEKWLKRYATLDVVQCEALFKHQRIQLFRDGLEKVFYTRCLQSPVLADIEFNGMFLDKDAVNEEYLQVSKQLSEVEAELDEFTGGLNPRSNKQMAEFIYDVLKFDEPLDYKKDVIRTPKGERSASSIAISLLKPRNAKQKKFIELKQLQAKLNAQVTKALGKFQECCTKGESILYASINQCITATGRYSSTGKNYSCQFQNIERGFKSLFKARNDDWRIGEADEAQLEFRTAIFFGQDLQGFQDIKEKADVHAYTASIIGCTRQEAKSHTFKPLYGGTSGTPAEKKYYAAFKEKYADTARVQDQWVDTALKSKELVLETGIKFYFPALKVTRSGYIEGNTSVRNYPVQYLATAEIVPIALVYAWHAIQASKAESFIINTIHDSIIAEIHPDEGNFFTEVMSKSLQDFPIEYMKKLYGIDFNVPLEAEIKIGDHWGS